MNDVNLIRPDGCSTCPHKFRDGKEMFCRLNPPTTLPIVGMVGGTPQVIAHAVTYPKVQPDWWCAQHPARKASLVAAMTIGSVA